MNHPHPGLSVRPMGFLWLALHFLRLYGPLTA